MCVHARYNSLSAAVTVCATLIQTHRQHFDQLIRKAQPAELKSVNNGRLKGVNEYVKSVRFEGYSLYSVHLLIQ